MRRDRGRYVEYVPRYVVYDNRPYGFWAFVGDAFMTVLTGGLWVIWIIVREMRRR